MIRDATEKDADIIARIYNYFITDTAFTFEEAPISVDEMRDRIKGVQTQHLPWLVALDGDDVVGYAYATKWKERSAYRFTVESTVYVAQSAQGKGLGTKLYQALLNQLKFLGINSVLGGITLPNPVSIALHEKVGMKKVAHLENVGYKFNEWRDVGYWQLNLSG